MRDNSAPLDRPAYLHLLARTTGRSRAVDDKGHGIALLSADDVGWAVTLEDTLRGHVVAAAEVGIACTRC
jgi:hypothetical protein